MVTTVPDTDAFTLAGLDSLGVGVGDGGGFGVGVGFGTAYFEKNSACISGVAIPSGIKPLARWNCLTYSAVVSV